MEFGDPGMPGGSPLGDVMHATAHVQLGVSVQIGVDHVRLCRFAVLPCVGVVGYAPARLRVGVIVGYHNGDFWQLHVAGARFLCVAFRAVGGQQLAEQGFIQPGIKQAHLGHARPYGKGAAASVRKMASKAKSTGSTQSV